MEIDDLEHHSKMGNIARSISHQIITPNEDLIIFKDSYGKMGLINRETKEKTKFLPFGKQTSDLTSFALDSKGKYIITGSRDGLVKVFDIKDILKSTNTKLRTQWIWILRALP